MSAANVVGNIYGLDVKVAGPAACFIVLIIIFHSIGLFSKGLSEEPELSNLPTEGLNLEEIDSKLDAIEIKLKQLHRSREKLGKAKVAIENGQTYNEILNQTGFHPVTRPGSR